MESLNDQLNLTIKRLRPCQTRVTNVDGNSWMEVKNEKIKECVALCPGFVIDVKPDLSVNRILDGLILGSQDLAQDLEILSSCRITHILNASVGIPNLFEGWFTYLKKNVLDNPEFPLIDMFDECCDFIHFAILSGGRVLVHCNAGVSRSASIVIAYLMKYNSMTLDNAFAFVKQKRSFIKPNEGFVRQLKEYEQRI
ncbi:Dual specificity protein phosphatase 19 [Armadillidium nasatum]|uniref:protein-serine/threonine phosphatase n=1 Tax=Armadillidium nasatum TaxID=96803 RepID=A0A5N5TLB2_9CRUS|nr:Dual specificity protein phosphatase 19 [Armadillidium nasatum]